MFFIFVVCSTASQKVTLFAVIEVLKGEYNGFIIVVFQREVCFSRKNLIGGRDGGKAIYYF